jgi:hypothetical protein
MNNTVHKVALAAAATIAIVYTAVVLFAVLAPTVFLQFVGWIVPVSNTGVFGNLTITFSGYFLGLIQLSIYTYVGTWLFGRIRNGLTQPSFVFEARHATI